MAKAHLLLLAHGHNVHHAGGFLHGLELFDLASFGEEFFKLDVAVEVVFHNALMAVGHKDDFRDTGADGFLNNVLDNRLVVDGEHFLGDILAGRKRTGTPTGNRKDDLADFHEHLSILGNHTAVQVVFLDDGERAPEIAYWNYLIPFSFLRP